MFLDWINLKKHLHIALCWVCCCHFNRTTMVVDLPVLVIPCGWVSNLARWVSNLLVISNKSFEQMGVGEKEIEWEVGGLTQWK